MLQYQSANTTTFMIQSEPASTGSVAAPILPAWWLIVPNTVMTRERTLSNAAHTAIKNRIRIGLRLPNSHAMMTIGRKMPARPMSHVGWNWPSDRAPTPRALTRSEAANAIVLAVSRTAMTAQARD